MKLIEQSPGHFRLHIPARWEALQRQQELAQFLRQHERRCWAQPEYTRHTPKVLEVVLRVFPQVHLPDLSPSLELPPVQQPNSQLIQSHLVDLQFQLAQPHELQDGAQKDHCVTLQGYAEVNGVPVPGSALLQYRGRLRNDLVAPGFYRHLLGMKAGEERTFRFSLPLGPERGSRKVLYHVHMLKVEALDTLPIDPKDQRFPQALDCVGWRELIQQLHEDLQNRYLQNWQKFVRQAVLESIVQDSRVDLPADLFVYTAQQIWQSEEGQKLEQLGLSAEARKLAWQVWQKDPEQHAKVYRELKRSLVIQAIAEQEALELQPEEIALFLQPFATGLQRDLTEIYAALEQQQELQPLLNQILAEKVCDWLLKRAQFSSQGQEYALPRPDFS